MKIILLIFLIVTTGALLKAQDINRSLDTNAPAIKQKNKLSIKSLQSGVLERNQNTHKTVNSRWYNYAFSSGNSFSQTNMNVLFPDTSILMTSGNESSRPNIHGLMNIIDPSSFLYNNNFNNSSDEIKIYEHMAYSLDEVGIYGWYYRELDDANVVDTLVFEIIYDRPTFLFGDMPFLFFVDNISQFKTDSMFVTTHPIDIATGRLYTWNKLVMKQPMTTEDTITNFFGYNYISSVLETPLNIDAGSILGVAAYFKPGYSWTPHIDTLFKKNYFVFFSNEENGPETYPLYGKHDYNQSDIVTSLERYDQNDQWYGMFSPSFIFNAGYSYENHWVEAKLTIQDFSIDEHNGNIKSISQFPNPANEILNIEFELNNSTDEVELILSDLVGKQFLVEKFKGNKGMNQHQINLSGVSNGIYLYSIRADGAEATKKFVVSNN